MLMQHCSVVVLTFVKRMVDRDLFYRTVGVVHLEKQRLSRLEVLQSENIHFGHRIDLIIVFRIGECQRQHTLFLQIGLVNAGK